MLADGGVEQFWMHGCCAFTDISVNILLNPKLTVKNLFCREDWVFVTRSSQNIDSVTIFSEFELLFSQLLKLSSVSQQNLFYLKTRLADLANELIYTTVNSNGLLWQKNHFKVA